MLTRLALSWIIFAAVLGTVLGGCFVWALQSPNAVLGVSPRAEQHAGPEKRPQEEREKSDDALARYTFWLTVFTAVLALATLGLGVATLFLYFAGEKHVAVAMRAADAATAAAEHIPTVEGAYLRVILIEDAISGGLAYIEQGESQYNLSFAIRIALKNYGKTPAFVESFSARLSYVTNKIGFGRETRIPPNIGIGTGEETIPYPVAFPHLSPLQCAALRGFEAKLILRGTLVYRDIWNAEWTVPFDGRFGGADGFRIDNQPRRKSADS